MKVARLRVVSSPVFLLIVCSFLFCACKYDVITTKRKRVAKEKYPVLITASEIAQHVNIALDTSGRSDSAIARILIDGTEELEYVYDVRNTTTFEPLFYNITIRRAPTNNSASLLYRAVKKAILQTSEESGIRLEVKNELKPDADASYYALRFKEDEPAGFVFIALKKNIVYTLILSGFFGYNDRFMTDLILPRMDKLDQFRIKERF